MAKKNLAKAAEKTSVGLGTKTTGTVKISVSLTEAERDTLEARSAQLRGSGHRDLKLSRLARVAFTLLDGIDDTEVVAQAQKVENLESRRGK